MNEYSYIIKSTYSQLLSVTNCPLCNYSTYNHDPIQIITLHMKEGLKTLYDLLSDFVKMEILDNDNTWKCDKCQERVNPEKKNIFWNLSDVLIFQIKRYNNNLTKNNGHIKFPLLLKMGRFCMNYNESSTQYELCAISIQMGSLNGGHYIAICKDDFDSLVVQLENILGMDDPFVVYCSDDDCGSSEELSYELQSYGFNNIYLFKGGWKEWQNASLPEEK